MPLTNYRLYCLSERGGITLADWIVATSDEEAVAKARHIEHGAPMVEVWESDRLIATLKRGEASASA